MANNSSDRKPFKPPFEILERKTKPVLIKYKDCMRNHAPHLGVNVVDGCGEFAPKRRRSEAARRADHDDLACAACGCHRNFHRKEVVKKITLKFIENEQANWFNFHPLSPQTIDDDEEEPVEIDEVLNEKTTKKPKN